MNLRARIGRLERSARDIPPPGQLDLVVCVPVGCDAAEGRPPGAYPNSAGNVIDVVFAGPEPDTGVLAPLQARLSKCGLAIVSHTAPADQQATPSQPWFAGTR